MTTLDLNSIIALVLIKKENFRDSYSLTKVLAWKFGIITVSDIIIELEDSALISRVINNGISKYNLTSTGLEYVEANKGEITFLLLKKFKDEQGFIESLLK